MKASKKAELFAKSLLSRAFRRNRVPKRIASPADAITLPENPKILLLRHDRIGDVLVTTPTLRHLRQALPKARLDMLMSNRNSVARRAFEKYADNIIVYSRNILNTFRLISGLRATEYDLVIDLFDNASTTSEVIVALVKAHAAVGFEKENSSLYDYIVPLPDKRRTHIVRRIANLLLIFGINPESLELKLEYSLEPDEADRAINKIGQKTKLYRLGIVIGGSSEAKSWGLDNYLEFASQVNTIYANIEIVAFATNKNSDMLQMLLENSGVRAAPLVDSFHEFAAMLHTCDIILTPDTSAVHLAAAWQKPCLALYDTSGVEVCGMPWTPYCSPHVALCSTSGSLADITVAEAMKSLNRLLKYFICHSERSEESI